MPAYKFPAPVLGTCLDLGPGGLARLQRKSDQASQLSLPCLLTSSSEFGARSVCCAVMADEFASPLSLLPPSAFGCGGLHHSGSRSASPGFFVSCGVTS